MSPATTMKRTGAPVPKVDTKVQVFGPFDDRENYRDAVHLGTTELMRNALALMDEINAKGNFILSLCDVALESLPNDSDSDKAEAILYALKKIKLDIAQEEWRLQGMMLVMVERLDRAECRA